MTRNVVTCLFALAGTLLIAGAVNAKVISVTEPDGGEPEGVSLEQPFAEDALSFTDRTHEHNGAVYDSATGLLSTTGDTTIALPAYLVGNQYIKTANDARDNDPYSLSITVDCPSFLYLLIDNRLDGPNDNKDKTNTTPPIIGGDLAWVNTMGFAMVNTGIMPNGQPDFTGVDESGDGDRDQFYTVFELDIPTGTTTLGKQGIGGSNMYSVVVAPVPEPSTFVLCFLGLLGLAVYGWRKRS